MMRSLVTADIHFSSHYFLSPIKNKLSLRLIDSIRCMIYLMEQAIMHNCDNVVIIGDILHQSGVRIPYTDLIVLRDLLKMFPVRLFIIGGNHDITDNVWVIKLLEMSNTHIIVEPEVHYNISFIPYGYDPIASTSVAFWHGMLMGANLSNGYRAREGIERLDPDVNWLLGHVHKHQTIDNATYVGSPYRISFNEEHNVPVICILNDGVPQWYKTNLPPRFLTMRMSDDIIDVEDAYIKLIGDNWQELVEKKHILKSMGARGVIIQCENHQHVEVDTSIANPMELIRKDIENNPPPDEIADRVDKLLAELEEKLCGAH